MDGESATNVVLLVLVFGHVLSAMGWLGGGLLNTLAVAPNLGKLSQAATLEFNTEVIPRMIGFVQATAGLTILFGLLLLYYVYSQDSSYFSSTSGMDVLVGIVLAVVAAAIAFSVAIPSFRKVSKLAASVLGGSQQAPPPEMMTHAKRARQVSMIVVILLLITLVAMVAAGIS